MKIAFTTMLAGLMLLAIACRAGVRLTQKETSGGPLAAEKTVDAAILADDNGSVQAVVSARNPNGQVVRGSALSPIAGASAKFLPGAFSTDLQVTLETGPSLATPVAMEMAGLSGFAVVAAGEPVTIYWPEELDAARPFVLSIPAPRRNQPSLYSEEILYVIYSANVVDSDVDVVGSLTGSDLQLIDGFVTFSRQSFGIYQALLLSPATGDPMPRPTSTKTSAVQSTDPDEDNSPTPVENPEAQKPQPFNITAPVDDLNAHKIVVRWEKSQFASSFDVVIARDEACKLAAVTVKDIKNNALATLAIADGSNYICVFANGEYGVTPASNNGFMFLADIKGPEKPAPPTISLSGNIGVHVTWLPVDDLGTAGMARYGLEITTAFGKSLGEADIFNGELSVSETEKDAIGFIGETYYARVRGIDAVGNEGPWSEWSEPLTLIGSD